MKIDVENFNSRLFADFCDCDIENVQRAAKLKNTEKKREKVFL
jgi:hypothetical protein